MQPFCIELSINLLLYIRWASRQLETKLKKSFPSRWKALLKESQTVCSQKDSKPWECISLEHFAIEWEFHTI